MAPITRVAFEYRLNDGPRMRVVADPAVRSVPIFEHMDASGSWRQAVLTDVPPEVLMEIGLMVATARAERARVSTSLKGLVTIDLGNITGVQSIGAPVVVPLRNITRLPRYRAKLGHGREVKTEPSANREVVTFPLELDEKEIGRLMDILMEKFYGNINQRQGPPPPEVDRLLEKLDRAQNKFRDKRIADEEFAASLTDEEREVIRARRANAGRTDK